MHLRLECDPVLAPQASAVLQSLGQQAPTTERIGPSADSGNAVTKLGPSETIALLALLVALPSSLEALASLRQRLDRRQVRNTLRALKAKIEETGGEAVLELPSGRCVDLAETATDVTIDLVIAELGEERPPR